MGRVRLAGPRAEAPPSGAGWLSGRLPEGGQPKTTVLRVTSSWRPPSKEGGNGQAATSRPRCGRAPIESTSQSMATVRNDASHIRDRRGYSAPYRRRSPHDGALCRIYPDVAPGRRSPVPHDGLSVRPTGGGPYRAMTPRKTAEAQPDGFERGRPPAGGRPLSRGEHAINLIRPGVATVASHQAVGL